MCNCTTCDKYFGFGGLGKSEGKFNYTNGFGGELEKKVGKEGFIQLMAEVDEILCKFGGSSVSKYSTENSSLTKRAEACGLQMLTTEVRHLGTTLSSNIFQHSMNFTDENKDPISYRCTTYSETGRSFYNRDKSRNSSN